MRSRPILRALFALAAFALVLTPAAARADPPIYLPFVTRSAASPATVGPTLGGCPLFPADNIWNRRIDALPAHPQSATFTNTIGADIGLHPDFGSGTWDGGPIGIPYNLVPSSQPNVPITFLYADESDPSPYPIPPGAQREWGSDHHILIIQQSACLLYEVYAAETSDGGASWMAGSGARWNLLSHALRPDTWTSADAAGLPMLPGLVRYDEVAAGEIKHAIRFTLRGTNGTHVWPARHRTPSATHNDANLPPMGQRFRLKASFSVTSFSRETQVILTALKQYGVMMADNGADWYIGGAPDARWNNDTLVSEFLRVHGGDFEAVDISSLMIDPNSGQAR